MPAATAYITDQRSKAWHKLEQDYKLEQNERRARIKSNWDYYQGKHRRPLKADSTGTEDNLIINLMENIVDKDASRNLGISDEGIVLGVTFDIIDRPGDKGFVGRVKSAARRIMRTAEPTSPAQTLLDAAWEANHRDAFLLELMITGSVCGHVFVKSIPNGRANPKTGAMDITRLVNLNPANTSCFWREDDYETVLWYRIEYGNTRQDIVRLSYAAGDYTPINYDVNLQTDGWLIYNYARSTQQGRWVRVGEPEVWDYPWPPIIDWQNQPNPFNYYGKSDLGTLGPLNDGLNFVASNTQRIIKHHASPKTIGIGMNAGEVVETQVDGLWTVQASKIEADIFNLEMQSDLGSSIAFVKMLMNLIHELSRDISPSAVSANLGAITNFGLRVMFYDPLTKSGIKRLLLGEGLVKLCRCFLEIGGQDPNVQINVGWPDPLPSDPLQQAQALAVDAEHGLSNATYLERRGYDPTQEEQRSESEAPPAPTVDPNSQIGDSLQGMQGITRPKQPGDQNRQDGPPGLGKQRYRPR